MTTIQSSPHAATEEEILELLPQQGDWSESGYLWLTNDTNKLIEFTDGHLEILAMPTISHQRILMFLLRLLSDFVARHDLGEALMAALRVRLRPGMFREPDIVFIKKERAARSGNDFFDGADLVMEVVSDDPKSRHRDLVQKRREYAENGIPEYWIVDPQEQRITVLKLEGTQYAVHGEWTIGQTARSALLEGFEVAVKNVFDAARR